MLSWAAHLLYNKSTRLYFINQKENKKATQRREKEVKSKRVKWKERKHKDTQKVHIEGCTQVQGKIQENRQSPNKPHLAQTYQLAKGHTTNMDKHIRNM